MSDASTQGIKTVLHPVSDLEAAKAVYTALLGVPPTTDGPYYVGFEAAGQHIGLVPGGGPQGMTSPVAYWHVPDIEAKLAEVTAAGATVKEPAHDVGGGRLVATVTDPDGNVLGLLQDRGGPTPAPAPNRWRHDEQGHEDGHAVACAAGCRQPRSDPRARRAREQPQGPQRRAPEAPADGVHRRLRLGQELAGVRHDRRGVAAADQRDLQRLRAGLHADAGAAGGRRTRRPDDRDHRRPGAHGRQRPLHSRHRDRRQRDAADRLQPARRAECRAVVPLQLQPARRRLPALRRHGQHDRHRPDPALRPEQVARRGRADDPRLQRRRLDGADLHRVGLPRRRQADPRLHREPTKVKLQGINMTYEGLIPKIQKSFLSKDPDAMQPHIRAFVERAVTFTACPDCGGSRLNEAARASRIRGINIADACAMQISDLAEWVRGLDEPSVAPLLATLQQTLDSFVEIGLGYLSLERPSGTLSGGEAQRTKMIRHLGSSLTDVTYVFDEPTIGLHPHDIQRMNDLLLRLRDKGNTVLVVEHKPETIAIADHVVDLGPGAGTAGGTVCFEGTLEGLRASGTITGRHLDDRAALKETVRTPTGTLEILGATAHNLRDVDVDIPLGVLVVVTGVAGSGKSSLVHGSIPAGAGVVSIDQGAIRGSRRSNPATYTGLLDPIRTAFAKANGVKPALFSANSEGACPNCNGAGVIYTDLAMMAGVATTCEECEGKRFQASVLDHHLGGRDISEVLAMPVTEAGEFFGAGQARTPAAHAILDRLADVGLGYLSLGQPLTTLSGGERQRLKLATRMAEKGGVYVLDEPTAGLHLADVQQLLGLLGRLVDSGKSVIVIEHHQAVMAHADWIIDLGPGAGHDGGRIVFEGTPADLLAARSTLTGEHLAAYVGT